MRELRGLFRPYRKTSSPVDFGALQPGMAKTTAWPAFLLFAVVAAAGCDEALDKMPWRGFTMASTSMEPTLPKGTRLTAVSVRTEDLARGDIVFVRRGDETWVSRLVGLPGDRVALAEGIVVLNGKRISQRPVGRWAIEDYAGQREVAMLAERLPGERQAHRVLDSGYTPQDNFEEVELRPDRYFVLGDNRDNSADSRFDGEVFGLGLVKGSDIERRLPADRP